MDLDVARSIKVRTLVEAVLCCPARIRSRRHSGSVSSSLETNLGPALLDGIVPSLGQGGDPNHVHDTVHADFPAPGGR
jgi:hypothetical protein